MSSGRKYRVILEPNAPFSGDIDSIKIAGSIVRAFSELYGDPATILEGIKRGEVRVSSPMPVVSGKYYLFKPLLKTKDMVDYKDFKRFKRIRYVREDHALAALREGEYSRDIVDKIINDRTETYHSDDLPGVFVSRSGGATRIYYKDALHFLVPLWMVLEVSDALLPKVQASLKYLGDVGISKKRSSGFGSFEVKWEDYDIDDEVRKYRMLLSKYVPSEEELRSFPFERARYDIKMISGYTGRGTPIPPVRVLVEGSVYPSELFDLPHGRVVDVDDMYSLIGVPVVI